MTQHLRVRVILSEDQVQFPARSSDSLQLPWPTTKPGNLTPSALEDTALTCTYSYAQIHNLKKKTFLKTKCITQNLNMLLKTHAKWSL